MMSTLESVVRAVEQAIASGTPERRSRPLRRITDLFVEQAPQLKDDHVSAYDEVISRLARKVDSTDRIELSRRLADIGNAPVGVVKDLAQDADIAVAGPILERSTRLTDDDLIAITEKKTQGHLLAVSRRRSLSERVADALVKRGDQRVVHSVAQNQGAKLSEWTLASLVQKTLGDNALRKAMLQRLDLPSGSLPAYVEPAPRPKSTPRLKSEAVAEMRRVETVLEKLGALLTAPPSQRDISPAIEHLARTASKKGVQEVRVASWI